MLGVCLVWPLMEVQFLVLWHVWIFKPWRLVLSPVQALSRDTCYPAAFPVRSLCLLILYILELQSREHSEAACKSLTTTSFFCPRGKLCLAPV